MAAAILDRILHHSTTINIKGEIMAKRKEEAGNKNRKSCTPLSAVNFRIFTIFLAIDFH